MNDNNFEITISSDSYGPLLNAKEVFRYRDLIWLMVKRNLSLFYKQTVLGPLWLVLSPLLTSLMYTFVFGQFAGISTDGLPNFLFYLVSASIWTLFSSTVSNTANTFILNYNVFGKVYFPRLTVPISQAITSLINYLLQFAISLIFVGIYRLTGFRLNIQTQSIFLLPLLILQINILGLGIGLIVTSVTVKYRDLSVAVTFFMQLWMYASPIIYAMSSTGGWMRRIVLLNPVTPIVNNFRYVFFGVGEFLVWPWVLSIAVTALAFISGCVIFNITRRNFIDVV